jgi:hypothetical protein
VLCQSLFRIEVSDKTIYLTHKWRKGKEIKKEKRKKVAEERKEKKKQG